MLSFTVCWNSVLFLVFVGVALYYYMQRKLAIFKNAGAPYIKASSWMGSFSDNGKLHISQIMKRAYDEMKGQGPYGGFFFFLMPGAITMDLDFIKMVCIKDFGNFQNKGIYYNEEDEPLTAHLFSLDGAKWKTLRHKLSPTFTSGKMKNMFGTVVEVGEKFRAKLLEVCEKSDAAIDVNNILGRFTTDVIGSCAFGIESNSLDNEDNLFRRMGIKMFKEQRQKPLGQILMMSFPNIAKKIGMKLLYDDVSEFFLKVVRDTIDYRLQNDVKRNDFMDMLINMMPKDGEPKDESHFTFEEIAAQAFVFFLAGFETSSTLLTFCLYELSINQDIQEKVRQEVADVMARHDGKLSYEAVMDMKYMDQVLNESLRKYPPLTETMRQSNEDYPIEGTNMYFPKKTMIFVPIYALHHDPELYPEPQKFDPERFSAENVLNRHSCAFIPFGEGPRNCIGMRFGLMQAKIGLAVIVTTLNLTLNEKTKVPLTFEPKNAILCAEGGIWLNAKPIQKA